MDNSEINSFGIEDSVMYTTVLSHGTGEGVINKSFSILPIQFETGQVFGDRRESKKELLWSSIEF